MSRSGVAGWCVLQRTTLLLQLLVVDLHIHVARTDELRVQDRFNYGATDWIDHNYGPEDWNLVLCNNVATCVSTNDGSVPALQGETASSRSHPSPSVRSRDGPLTGRSSTRLSRTTKARTRARTAPTACLDCVRTTDRARSHSIATSRPFGSAWTVTLCTMARDSAV